MMDLFQQIMAPIEDDDALTNQLDQLIMMLQEQEQQEEEEYGPVSIWPK